MTPHILSNDGINETIMLFLGGAPITVDASHQSFEEIKAGVQDMEPRDIRDLMDLAKKVAKKVAAFGNITVEDDAVFYKGEVVHGLLSDRMLDMLAEGKDIRSWALFMENLQQNPAKHAVDELYLWLERSKMPITERGNFLAYKKVKDDYTSYHNNADGSVFRNDLGTFCSMPRNKVDDNRNKTCSTGLHFCSWDYLPSYMGNQGKVMVVEVNPAHVVSIPSDYNNAKGRCEGYLVVGELPESEAEHAFRSSQADFGTSDWITWDQDEDIDYSDIEDGWYSDYEEHEDDAWDEAYNSGFTQGERDAHAYKVSNSDTAFFYENISEDFFDDFAEGYDDGFYSVTVKQAESDDDLGDVWDEAADDWDEMHGFTTAEPTEVEQAILTLNRLSANFLEGYGLGYADQRAELYRPLTHVTTERFVLADGSVDTNGVSDFIDGYEAGFDAQG